MERNGQGRRRMIVSFAVFLEMAGLWLRTHRVGGRLVVRCRAGHLFTTLWMPGISIKSLKLGMWRYQRCAVGRHWSLVTPVDPATLTARERRRAAKHRDLPIP
jgi:hypothetical protein